MEFRADRSHAVLPTRGPNQDQFGDIDMPTLFSNGKFRIVVRRGETYSAMLLSGRRPDAEATLFEVTPLDADWKRASSLGAMCTAALEGAHGAMNAVLAPTRDSVSGFMGGLGVHEWVGGKHDPGRRNVPYATGLSELEAAAYHTRMQRNTMPALTTGTTAVRPGARVDVSMLTVLLRAPSSPLLPAWALTFKIVYCFWAFSVALCNAMHYDTGDKGPSRAVWFWSGNGVGVRCGAWFILPNHGVAVELGQCTIRWRGDLLMHGTHQTEAGRACPNDLLSVWNGVGGALLRSRLDQLAFTSTACGRKFWATIPPKTPVVVRKRARGTAQAKGLWTHRYGVTSTSKAPTRASTMVRMDGCDEKGNAYVKVVTKKSGGTTKTRNVQFDDARVRWSVLTTAQIAQLVQAVGTATDVATLIAEHRAREVDFVDRAHRGETAAQAKRQRKKRGRIVLRSDVLLRSSSAHPPPPVNHPPPPPPPPPPPHARPLPQDVNKHSKVTRFILSGEIDAHCCTIVLACLLRHLVHLGDVRSE
jgi:hypothetical protein